MTFSRVGPGPGWGTGELLSSTQMNQMDLNVERALDGYAGGLYTPSAPLIIGGSGMQVPNGATWNILSGGNLTSDVGGAIVSNGTARFVELEIDGTASVDLNPRTVTRMVGATGTPT